MGDDQQKAAGIESYRAYSAQRYAQLLEGEFAFWVYRADVDCPAQHQELNGLALQSDHDFWRQYYPPLDDECGCYVVGARSEACIRRLGGDPERTIPEWCLLP